MSLGQSLSIGATVGLWGPGGAGTPIPALVTGIQAPTGVATRYISGISFPGGVATAFQSVNHRSLTADGSGWDFSSALPSFSL